MSREISGNKRPFSDKDRQQGNAKTREELCPLKTRCEAGKNAECKLAHTRSQQTFWLAEAKKEKAEKAAAKATKKAAKLLTAPPGPPPGLPPLFEAAVLQVRESPAFIAAVHQAQQSPVFAVAAAVQQAQQDNAPVPPFGGIEIVTPAHVLASLREEVENSDPQYTTEEDPQYSDPETVRDELVEADPADPDAYTYYGDDEDLLK